MKLWVCAGCATAYEAGIPRCPECALTDYKEYEVPKATTGGASNARECADEAEVQPDVTDPAEQQVEKPADGKKDPVKPVPPRVK